MKSSPEVQAISPNNQQDTYINRIWSFFQPYFDIIQSSLAAAETAARIYQESRILYLTSQEIYALTEDARSSAEQLVQTAESLKESVQYFSEFLSGPDLQEQFSSQLGEALKVLSAPSYDQVRGNVGQMARIGVQHGLGVDPLLPKKLYDAASGVYGIYKLYNDVKRVVNSLKACGEIMYNSADHLAYLTGGDKAIEAVMQELKSYWNQPSSFQLGDIMKPLQDYWNQPSSFSLVDLQSALGAIADNLSGIVEPLKPLLALYETSEPVRLASYLALVAPDKIENKPSQLGQMTELLVNYCSNQALALTRSNARSVGNVVGRGAVNLAISAGKEMGMKAVLSSAAVALAGVSMPITIMLLASAVNDDDAKKALIEYAKSLVSKDKVDNEEVLSFINSQIESVEKDKPSLFKQAFDAAADKVSNVQIISKITEGSRKLSGKVTAGLTENVVMSLLQDQGIMDFVRQQLADVIYPTLDAVTKSALGIPAGEELTRKVQALEGQSAVYEVCGALMPQVVNHLELPALLEQNLQRATGNQDVCKTPNLDPVDRKDAAVRAGARVGVYAAKTAINFGQAVTQSRAVQQLSKNMLNAGQNAAKKFQRSESKDAAPLAVVPVSAVSFENLGSSENLRKKIAGEPSFDYEKRLKHARKIAQERPSRAVQQVFKLEVVTENKAASPNFSENKEAPALAPESSVETRKDVSQKIPDQENLQQENPQKDLLPDAPSPDNDLEITPPEPVKIHVAPVNDEDVFEQKSAPAQISAQQMDMFLKILINSFIEGFNNEGLESLLEEQESPGIFEPTQVSVSATDAFDKSTLTPIQYAMFEHGNPKQINHQALLILLKSPKQPINKEYYGALMKLHLEYQDQKFPVNEKGKQDVECKRDFINEIYSIIEAIEKNHPGENNNFKTESLSFLRTLGRDIADEIVKTKVANLRKAQSMEKDLEKAGLGFVAHFYNYLISGKDKNKLDTEFKKFNEGLNSFLSCEEGVSKKPGIFSSIKSDKSISPDTLSNSKLLESLLSFLEEIAESNFITEKRKIGDRLERSIKKCKNILEKIIGAEESKEQPSTGPSSARALLVQEKSSIQKT